MRAMRLPILILGLNGVPGYALFRHFNKLYGNDVIGIRPIKHPCVFGDNVFGVDAEETERLGELFERFHFGTVIDASGNCALKACECDPARSRLLNFSQGVDAATFAARYNATLIAATKRQSQTDQTSKRTQKTPSTIPASIRPRPKTQLPPSCQTQ